MSLISFVYPHFIATKHVLNFYELVKENKESKSRESREECTWSEIFPENQWESARKFWERERGLWIWESPTVWKTSLQNLVTFFAGFRLKNDVRNGSFVITGDFRGHFSKYWSFFVRCGAGLIAYTSKVSVGLWAMQPMCL